MSADLVIARFNENIDYLNEPEFRKFQTIYLYNKGNDTLFLPKLPPNVSVIKLPNVGCEQHTYLTHIINHYGHELPDKMVFFPASYRSRDDKLIGGNYIVNNYEKYDAIFFGHPTSSRTVVEDMWDFTITDYRRTSTDNNVKNPST